MTPSLRTRRFVSLLFPCLLFAPGIAFAQIFVGIGTRFDLWTIAQRIITYMATSITAVCGAIFLVGAFMIILAGAKEDYKQRGKDLMVGSLMGMGVVLGAYAILRTVAFFIGAS